MKVHPDVDCYFYKAHPDLTQPYFLEDQTLWIRMSENLTTVYDKTLRAFEYFGPKLHEYDFVYRSNLSTFPSFHHMLEFCATLPKTNCCAGIIGGIPPEDEVRHSLNYGFSFPGGNGFLLTPDLVRRIVEEKITLVEQDDVTIGIALHKWGVPITEFVRPDFRDDGFWYVNNNNLLEPHDRNLNPKRIMFTYRIKSVDREKDAIVFDSLIRSVYNV
jgi:hypothetical protein